MQKTLLRGAVLALTLGTLAACSSTPAPQGEMAVAQSAVQRISANPQVTTYAPVELQQARDLLGKAQKSMGDKDYTEARRYFEEAETKARMAESKAQAAEGAARLQAVQRTYQTLPNTAPVTAPQR